MSGGQVHVWEMDWSSQRGECWLGLARGAEALSLETEAHLSRSDKQGVGGGRRGSYSSVCPEIRASQGPISGSQPATGPHEA